MCHDKIVDLYERHARDYDHDRSRRLMEREWLDRFLVNVGAPGILLDIGCGVGEPIGRYLMESGNRVVGVDSSRTMIGFCRERFPQAEWIVGDMRMLSMDRTFDGIVAWDSFFHLRPDDQRAMFPRFAQLASPGAPLMFTSGTGEGSAIGSYCGEPLYHGSLSPTEYRRLLEENGFRVEAHGEEDPDCGGHTVWLAVSEAATRM